MKKSEGFTLIELLVSIAILALLLIVSIPQFRTYGKQAQLKDTATELKSLILRTRGLALSPRTEDTGISKYQIIISEQNDRVHWEIKGIAKNESYQNIVVDSGDLEKIVIVNEITADNPRAIENNTLILDYLIPSGDINRFGSNSANQYTIQLKHKQTNDKINLDIIVATSQITIGDINIDE
jgi:prepilin-type N-terminal cleavage/methylation domain-containing protein